MPWESLSRYEFNFGAFCDSTIPEVGTRSGGGSTVGNIVGSQTKEPQQFPLVYEQLGSVKLYTLGAVFLTAESLATRYGTHWTPVHMVECFIHTVLLASFASCRE